MSFFSRPIPIGGLTPCASSRVFIIRRPFMSAPETEEAVSLVVSQFVAIIPGLVPVGRFTLGAILG